MEAWDYIGTSNGKYVELSFSQKGQAHLQGENRGFRNAIIRQVIKALGGFPSSWKWEVEGSNVFIAAAGG